MNVKFMNTGIAHMSVKCPFLAQRRFHHVLLNTDIPRKASNVFFFLHVRSYEYTPG